MEIYCNKQQIYYTSEGSNYCDFDFHFTHQWINSDFESLQENPWKDDVNLIDFKLLIHMGANP